MTLKGVVDFIDNSFFFNYQIIDNIKDISLYLCYLELTVNFIIHT